MRLYKLLNPFAVFVLLAVAALAPAQPARAQALTYESCFQVQNLEGGTESAAITISYYAQGSSTPIDVPDTILPNRSKTYCPLTAVPDGFNGSVVISSNKKIAAIANVTGGSPAWSSFDASYSGFTGGANTINLPLLMKGNYGYNTWFNVQNAGGSDVANITINYSDGTSRTDSIGINQAKTFDQSSESHSLTVFAARITSSQPIVVTVMEVGPTMLFGYNGFTTSVQQPVMPLVQANNYGYTSGVQIQNTGSTSTQVTVTYTPSLAGTACTETKTIAGGASETFALNAWASNDPNPSQNTCVNGQTFVGAAKVTTNSASQGLVAIVNQHNFSQNKGAAYGSFNPDAGSAIVVMPLIMDRNYGYFTGFNVMNAGTNQVTVSCTFVNSSVTVPPTVLQPGQALTHVQSGAIANGYVGAATCTATGTNPKIIGVVNELNSSGTTDTFLVYEAFNN